MHQTQWWGYSAPFPLLKEDHLWGYTAVGATKGPSIAFQPLSIMVPDHTAPPFPLSPTRPGLPRADPLELSFTQPIGGFSQPTATIDLALGSLAFNPMGKNSTLSLIRLLKLDRSTLPVLERKLFLCNHKCHTAMGNKTFQQALVLDKPHVLFLFFLFFFFYQK